MGTVEQIHEQLREDSGYKGSVEQYHGHSMRLVLRAYGYSHEIEDAIRQLDYAKYNLVAVFDRIWEEQN